MKSYKLKLSYYLFSKKML